MTEIFVDKPNQLAHADFQTWRRTHKGGYFINCKSESEGLLHSALCGHPGDTEWQCGDDGLHSLTKKAKVCSTSLLELNLWAAGHGIKLKKCAHCGSPSGEWMTT